MWNSNLQLPELNCPQMLPAPHNQRQTTPVLIPFLFVLCPPHSHCTEWCKRRQRKASCWGLPPPLTSWLASGELIQLGDFHSPQISRGKNLVMQQRLTISQVAGTANCWSYSTSAELNPPPNRSSTCHPWSTHVQKTGMTSKSRNDQISKGSFKFKVSVVYCLVLYL